MDVSSASTPSDTFRENLISFSDRIRDIMFPVSKINECVELGEDRVIANYIRFLLYLITETRTN